MFVPDLTRTQRHDFLAARGLDSWPTVLEPSQAAVREALAHVDVEAAYRPGHFEDVNFGEIQLGGAHRFKLCDGVRYRVEGLLEPGMAPGMLCAGYNGATLHPFEIEAVTRARPVEHAGLAIRAHRSPGWRSAGRGDGREPRQSRLDVLVGCSAGVVYVAVLRVAARASEAFAIHMPCRDAWRGMFPADDPPSPFFHLESLDTADPVVAVPLPDDPAAALRAIRERLIAAIQRRRNSVGADALFMAFTPDDVHCLRIGGHRVLRRAHSPDAPTPGSGLTPLLWEHTMGRHPPPLSIPERMQRVLLSFLGSSSRPCPVERFARSAGERWIAVSGGLFEGLPDEAVHDALGRDAADDIVAWLTAEADRLPDDEEHAGRREWSLLIVDRAAPRRARPATTAAALDMNALLSQLHELEKNRR